MEKRFKQQLEKQIRFLRNSCKEFDEGYWDEAIRIATCMRVLFHDTRHSTSLMEHMNVKDIHLITSLPPLHGPPEGFADCINIIPFSMGILTVGKNGGYGPNLEDYAEGETDLLPLEKWWNQVIWSTSTESKLSRKEIVLTAANQDGGAHVDECLEENYDEYSTYTFGSIIVKSWRFKIEIPVVRMHLVALRTMGNEVLKSPDFLALLD